MIVQQIDKTTNSVTIEISGMDTSYDRQTYVQIGKAITGETAKLYTLQTARNNGYIEDFEVSDINTNNGWIKVYIPTDYVDTYPVWRFRVKGLLDGVTKTQADIYTPLAFEYDGRNPKSAGEEIDITVRDLTVLNRFGIYINDWIGGNSGSSFNLKGSVQGSPIYADFLRGPAQYIYNNASKGDYASYVRSYTSYIIDNCTSGADFEAKYFNNIKEAIEFFYTTVVV